MIKRVKVADVKGYILLAKNIIWGCLKTEVFFLFINFNVIGLISMLFDLFIEPLTGTLLIQPLITTGFISFILTIPMNLICITEVIVDNMRNLSV